MIFFGTFLATDAFAFLANGILDLVWVNLAFVEIRIHVDCWNVLLA